MSSTTFTAEEVGSFRTLRSILGHISVPQLAEQAFLTAVGGADTMMPKALGIIPADEFANLMSEVRITEGSDEPANSGLLNAESSCWSAWLVVPAPASPFPPPQW